MPLRGGKTTTDDSSSIRRFLQRADAALDGLAACLRESSRGPRRKPSSISSPYWTDDARRTRAAIRLVLAQQAMSSQLIDNLNASIHIRAC